MTEDRVRVLWMVKGLGPGGAERLLAEHASAGDRRAFHYEAAFLLPWKRHLVPELDALGVRVHCLDVRSELDPRWLTRLARLLRRGRFDVVHVHSPSVAAPVRVLVRLRGRQRPALVYTEHNTWPSYRAATRIANRLTYRLDDATLAVSEDVRGSVTRRARPGVEVVVHGIDLARVRAHVPERDVVRAELGAGADDVLVVTIANLRAGKAYPDLLAAARLALDRGLPLRFAAAGQGPLEAEIRAEHARLDLGDRFRLLGYREDAARLLSGADVFALASQHEGLPVAVMEALALGVPVVAPAVGGLREAITSGEDGILVDAGRPQALADAFAAVCDPARRARLADGARRAGERFSSRAAVERVEQLYRQLADITGAPARPPRSPRPRR